MKVFKYRGKKTKLKSFPLINEVPVEFRTAKDETTGKLREQFISTQTAKGLLNRERNKNAGTPEAEYKIAKAAAKRAMRSNKLNV